LTGRTLRARGLRPAWWLAAALSCGACNGVDPEAVTIARCPDAGEFVHVSPWVESTCGTLDCHGQLARPMRVYGTSGLRLDAADRTGGDATTPAERDATMRSLCSLEPERTAEAVAGRLAADELLVVGKGRGDVHHEGGVLMRAGDDGDRCFITWLSGKADVDACDRAATSPE
jgi:hypothetical protein